MTMTRPTTEQITHRGQILNDVLGPAVSVTAFGAKGDGVADDTAAVQAAVGSGAQSVIFPEGTYKVTQTIFVPGNVHIFGAGIGATVLDGTAIASGFVLNFTGSPLVSIGSVSSATIDSVLVTMASAPSTSLSPNDVIILWNPTNGSWNAARTYYRQGEFCTVKSVSGSAVSVVGALYDTYDSASNVYLMQRQSASLESLSIKAPVTYQSGNQGAVEFVRIVNGRMSDVVIFGGTNSTVQLIQCYGFSISGVQLSDNLIVNSGDNYGIAVASCQDVDITGCRVDIHGSHAITVGGTGDVGTPISRAVRVDNCTICSSAGSAADTHGNAEFVSYTNCTISRGLLLGGNNITVKGCNIRGQDPAFRIIRMYEMRGCSVSITGNMIECEDSTTESIRIETYSGTVLGGLLDFSGNTIIARNATSDFGIVLGNRKPGLTKHRVRVSSNQFVSLGAATVAQALVSCTSEGVSAAAPWEYVEISGNYGNSKLNFVVDRFGGDGVTDVVAVDVVFRDNVLNSSYDSGLIAQAFTRLKAHGNAILSCANSGMWIRGTSLVALTPAELVDISGNTFVSCATNAPTVSLTHDADIYVDQASSCAIYGNSHFSSNTTKPRSHIYAQNIASLYVGEYAAMYDARVLPVNVAPTAFAAGSFITGSATYDPPNLNDGAGATTTLTVTGAALGDAVDTVSFSLDLQGITLTAYVSAANTVSVRFQNESGGTLDLGSGTLRVRVRKS